ncbi:MAG: DegT/DnrJ/EryC1/StrS family aminotransferase, partial [Hyphomicrobiaceae bacterium]
MSIESKPTEKHAHADVYGFAVRGSDGLFVGIERALDNGYGVVFVVDEAATVTGITDLECMRDAMRQGEHLAGVRMQDIAKPVDQATGSGEVTPVLGKDGQLMGVKTEPNSSLLPVAEPDLSHAEFRNVMDAYLSTWISSQGSYLGEFETRFARRCEMSQGVSTSNGTVALHLALAALGIGEGDDVIVPDLTFAACANTVIHVGARPILADVDPDTWCLSVETIEQAMTSRTRAIMPVHVFGRPAPMTEIAEFARSRGLFVIEDCAEAHGAQYDGKTVGSFSDISCFSFFANKIMTTGEGGICLTNDADLAARMRMLRDHGMRPERRYWHEEAGFNFRMTNLQAAIGCAQLDRLDELLSQRRKIYSDYQEAFKDVAQVTFPTTLPARFEPVVWFTSILVPPDRRNSAIDACRSHNIDIRPFTNGLSSMPAYRRYARA